MPSEPDSGTGELSLALQLDIARMVRHLGVQSVRASVVDIGSMAAQTGWSITDDGEVGDSSLERPLDSLFPNAAARVTQLSLGSAETTLVQKLSPRRWAFAWRLDRRRAAVTVAQFHERRDTVTDADTMLLRLLCNTGIRAGLASAAPAATSAEADSLVWPRVDRRAARQAQRPPRLSLGLAAAAALLTAWLALVAVAQTRAAASAQLAEVAQLRKMADGALIHGLSLALATGDYGDAQVALTSYATLGYFDQAVVTNTKGRVVAMDGSPERLRIGDPVTPEYAAVARPLELRVGSERQGQVLLVGPAGAGAAAAATTGLTVAAWLACIAALGCAGELSWRAFRQRA
jgi:hypothetical protein